MMDPKNVGSHDSGAAAKNLTRQCMKEQLAEFAAFRRALTEESDRGCALFAAAYLDKVLSDLLYLSVVENGKKVESDLFEGNAPLASFSSRIKMAFYLGRISAECRSELDTIRKIRNDFAHDASLISFETKSVADRCLNLTYSYQLKEARPRAHFTASCSRLLAILQVTALQSVAPNVKPDDRPSEDERARAREHADKAAKEVEELIAKEKQEKSASGPEPSKGEGGGDAT